jgi:hypothetical protein
VFLAGPGIGRWLVGVVRGRGDLAVSGGRLMAAGLVAFGVLALFFEVVVGIGSRGYAAPSGYALAALPIVAGLGLLGRRLLVASRSGGQGSPMAIDLLSWSPMGIAGWP